MTKERGKKKRETTIERRKAEKEGQRQKARRMGVSGRQKRESERE